MILGPKGVGIQICYAWSLYNQFETPDQIFINRGQPLAGIMWGWIVAFDVFSEFREHVFLSLKPNKLNLRSTIKFFDYIAILSKSWKRSFEPPRGEPPLLVQGGEAHLQLIGECHASGAGAFWGAFLA